MSYRFQFRRYRLPLLRSVRTAHEVWARREGLILRLEDEAGRVGLGEVAPIPAFGTETADVAEQACFELGQYVDEPRLAAIPIELGCVRNAVAAARAEIARPAEPAAAASTESRYRAVAALLPAGRTAVAAVVGHAEAGFRVFKWKVGVGVAADELSLLDDICAALPAGSRLRLDANGAWDRRRAELWFERCAERPIEFVEQPCFATVAAGETARRRVEDTLFGLARDYPTPVALDESLVGDGDVERWVESGWPGWFVVKPTLFGDPARALSRLETANATVVFSSALETAVGAKAALRRAFAWRGDAKALGFGVWPLFQNPQFDGPASAPFIRADDVERINLAPVWNALS